MQGRVRSTFILPRSLSRQRAETSPGGFVQIHVDIVSRKDNRGKGAGDRERVRVREVDGIAKACGQCQGHALAPGSK